VVAASGQKYVGVGTTALGWILCGILLIGAGTWIIRTRPWQSAGDGVDLELADVTPQPESD
jgi:hypothetical protein